MTFGYLLTLLSRQVGKTTLALQIAASRPSVYLDLKSPSDREKLSDAELYLPTDQDKLVIIEVKRSLAPRAGKGFHHACADLKPDARFMVYPGEERYPMTPDLEAISPCDLPREIGRI